MELLLIISKSDSSCLGTVRTLPALKVAVQGEELWIRGQVKGSAFEKELRKLPVLKTLYIKEDLLFPPDGLTPVGKLEPLDWKALTEFLPIELPLSAIPGKIAECVKVRLVSSETEHKEEAILTSLKHWKLFAEDTSEVRLKGLTFAASENGEVFIIGNPLPPLPGKAFWSREGIYLPCGYDFEFPVMAELINEKMNSFESSVLIFTDENKLVSVSSEHLVPASRSAIRMTKGGLE